ncbi:MAG: GldM family protein [Flavobacteriales bacterium]|nr:GldM family protein [Flavobacteriales bacterium]
MAGGKETPRQKMIGMMYLVLTALLAMNVSKEVLDSFVLVDQGLRKTESTLDSKNNDTMGAFAAKSAANPEKTKPFKDAADEVVKRSSELLEYIEVLKARTMSVSHNANALKFGEGYEEYMKDGVTLSLDAKDEDDKAIITKKDENQENTALLVGGAPESPKETEWSAWEMKNKLIAYKDFLKSIKFKEVTGKDWEVPEGLINSLDKIFTYEDGEEQGMVVKWETKNFFHNPLAAVIPVMTKLQVDVQNAQADMLGALLGGIEGKSYKFTNLVPLVVPQTSYILQGDTFRADVLLAAYDGTNPPRFYVEDKKWDGKDSSALTDVTEEMQLRIGGNGLGELKIAANQVGLGEHQFKGKIVYSGPSGDEDYSFYVPKFTVASPALVISPSKMNVFYRGLPNPVEISVPGIPQDKLRPSISGGHTLTKDGGEWVVKPGKANEAIISVSAEMPDGSVVNMGKKEFRVKRIPDPVPVFAGKRPSDSTVPKGDMSVAAGVRAEMENFDFDVNVKVESFNMIFIRDGQVIEKTANSNRVTDEMQANMKKVGKGQKIYIEKIKVKLPDGSIRQVANISLKVV